MRRVGHLALDHLQIFLVGIQVRDGVEQAYGVWMERLSEERSLVGVFDHVPGVHYGDFVAGIGDNAQIMRNQDHRGSLFVF